MDKQEIIRDIKQKYDGAGTVTMQQVADYLGVHRNTARRYVQQIEPLRVGTSKRYAVKDVATVLTGGSL